MDWFLSCCRKGSITYAHPRNQSRIIEVSLLPRDVSCLVFWTKFPSRMMEHLDAVESLGIPFYLQCTMNPYGQDMEPGIEPLERRIESYKALVDRIGEHRVVRRYDPVIITEHYPLEFHIDSFHRLAEALEGYSSSCIFSFVDTYRSTPGYIRELRADEMDLLAREFSKTGLVLSTCAEGVNLSQYGISRGACIDPVLVERITGLPAVRRKDPGQRRECRCMPSRDIGTYGTCLGGCVYCYAQRDKGLS